MKNTRVIKCPGCNRLVTRAEQRRQYGRLLSQGVSPEQAK